MANAQPNIQNLKPWQPGQSGNPKGRPPKARPITTALERLLEEPATSFELEMFPHRSFAEAIARRLLHIASYGPPSAAIAAAIEILDRVEVRPVERAGEE